MLVNHLELLVPNDPGRGRIVLRLHTDAGLAGLAEARLPGRVGALKAVLDAIGPHFVLGADPFESGPLTRRMLPADRGPVESAAAALVDVACWDLVGKALNVPLYRLFGGAERDRVRACASGWEPETLSNEEFSKAARGVLAKGYRALRLNPFDLSRGELTREDLILAVRRAEVVRAAVGPDVELILTIDGRLGPVAFMKAARALERVEPAWFEDLRPIGPTAATPCAGRSNGFPIARGPWLGALVAIHPFLQASAGEIVRLDVMRCGGLGEARKIAAVAEGRQVLVSLCDLAGPIGLAANLHLAVNLPNFRIVEHPVNGTDTETKTEWESGVPRLVDGFFAPPLGPGLGVTLCEAEFSAYPGKEGRG